MHNEEQLEEGIAGLKKIKFRAVLGKTQGKLTVCPAKSKVTGRLHGVKILSEDEKRVSTYFVNQDTEVSIYDGFELDLEDHIDAINWRWMKHLPELVASIEDSYSSPTALFYIENMQKDTENRILQRGYKTRAFTYFNESSQSKRVEICRILGVDATSMSPIEIEDYLGELADTSSKKLVAAFEDKLIKVKLFLYALVDKRIVTVDRDGVYGWGNHILGVNEKSALEWLQIKDNASYIVRLHDLVYPKPEATRFSGSNDLREIALPGPKVPETIVPEPIAPKDEEDFELDIPPFVPPFEKKVELSPEEVMSEAKEKYFNLFQKRAGNQSLENILTRIREEEAKGDVEEM